MKSDENIIVSKQTLAEKPFNEIISDGMYLFGKTYKTTIVYFIGLLVFSNLLIQILTVDLEWLVSTQRAQFESLLELFNSNPEAITDNELLFLIKFFLLEIITIFFQSLIGAFFTTLAMCSVANFLYKIYTKDKEMNSKPFKIKIFIPLTVIGLVVPMGFWILLFIPGIVVFVFYIFVVFTYNIEEIDQPLNEARLIAKYSYSKIILVFLFSTSITFIVNLIYQEIVPLVWDVSNETIISWMAPGTRNFLMLYIYRIVQDIIGILLAPLFISVLTVLFASLKARKDLGYERIPIRGSQLSITDTFPPVLNNLSTPSEPNILATIKHSESLERKYGKFCNYCGSRRDPSKLYCSNCGKLQEDLNDRSLQSSDSPLISTNQNIKSVQSKQIDICKDSTKSDRYRYKRISTKKISKKFCPFCGKRLDRTKDTCLNCGESLIKKK